MWKYRHRYIEDYESVRVIPVTLTRDFSAPNWNPPVAETVESVFTTPGFKCLTEAITDVVETDQIPYSTKKKELKPVCHYKRYTAYANQLPASVVSRMGLGSRAPDDLSNKAIERFSWYSPSTIAYGNYSEKLPWRSDPLLLVTDPKFVLYFGSFGDHFNGIPSMVSPPSTENVEYSTFYESPRAVELMGWIPWPDNLDVMLNAAYRHVFPHIRSEMSLPNTLLEYREAQNMSGDAKKILHNLAFMRKGNFGIPANWVGKTKLQRFLRRIRATFRGASQTMGEITRSVGSYHLFTQFGVKPLLDDITTLYKLVFSLKDSVHRLIKQQGKLQRKDFVYRWLPQELAADDRIQTTLISDGQFEDRHGTVPSGLTGAFRQYASQVTFHRYTIVNPAEFRYHVWYVHHIPDYQVKFASLLAFLDEMGVNLNPRIIWDAIPYSFLVDWIVKVGDFLETFKVENITPVVSITRTLCSVKYSRRTRLTVKSVAADGTIPNAVYLPDTFESAYRRSVSVPSIDDIIGLSGLSSREVVLGAALIAQRNRRPKSRLRVSGNKS